MLDCLVGEHVEEVDTLASTLDGEDGDGAVALDLEEEKRRGRTLFGDAISWEHRPHEHCAVVLLARTVLLQVLLIVPPTIPRWNEPPIIWRPSMVPILFLLDDLFVF